MTLQALLFDVDGTLADTERDGHRLAFNRAFAAAGLDWCWTWRCTVSCWPSPAARNACAIMSNVPPGLAEAEKFQLALVTRLHAAKTAHYTAMLAQGAIPLRPACAGC